MLLRSKLFLLSPAPHPSNAKGRGPKSNASGHESAGDNAQSVNDRFCRKSEYFYLCFLLQYFATTFDDLHSTKITRGVPTLIATIPRRRLVRFPPT